MADVETLIPVIDLRNQPILVAFDIEHGPFVHGVSVGERLSHIQQILPRCLLRNSEPRIQGRFQLGMPDSRFFEPFPIPIGATGWAAERIWNEVSKEPGRYYGGVDVSEDLATLGQNGRGNDEHLAAVFSMLEKLNR